MDKPWTDSSFAPARGVPTGTCPGPTSFPRHSVFPLTVRCRALRSLDRAQPLGRRSGGRRVDRVPACRRRAGLSCAALPTRPSRSPRCVASLMAFWFFFLVFLLLGAEWAPSDRSCVRFGSAHAPRRRRLVRLADVLRGPPSVLCRDPRFWWSGPPEASDSSWSRSSSKPDMSECHPPCSLRHLHFIIGYTREAPVPSSAAALHTLVAASRQLRPPMRIECVVESANPDALRNPSRAL